MHSKCCLQWQQYCLGSGVLNIFDEGLMTDMYLFRALEQQQVY